MQSFKEGPGRALLVICVSSGLWAFSFGLSAPLASLWLKHAGHSDTIIGFNTATYYAGLALAALFVPYVMRLCGSACATWGLAVAGLTVALFPWGDSLAWWFAIRLVSGMAGALCVIPMETYVNRDLAPQHRGRNFGLYIVALSLGWALGNWIGLDLAASMPRVAFLLGGLAAIAGAILVKAKMPAIPIHKARKQVALPLDWRENFLSFGSAWVQGFLEGGMVAFLSLYLIGQGLSEQRAGFFIGMTMLGVIAFQVPVTWLADSFGRLPVLLACYGLVAVGLISLPLAGSSTLLPISIFVVGACSAAFYPLGLALLGENLPTCELDRANAWYLSVECLGCLAGPALMGVARDWAGEKAMFVVGEAAVLLVLAFWLLSRRKDAPAAIPLEQPAFLQKAA